MKRSRKKCESSKLKVKKFKNKQDTKYNEYMTQIQMLTLQAIVCSNSSTSISQHILEVAFIVLYIEKVSYERA